MADDGSEYVDVEGVGEGEHDHDHDHGVGQFGFTSRGWKSHMGAGKIEEEWDGMEMEMEM